MSDNYNNCDCEQRESYDCDCKCCCDCEKVRPITPNRTTLKCGCPGAVTLPLATIAGTNFTVATVTVDTKGYRKPCIKFEFASNIVTTVAVLSLNFQIFKQCKNQLVLSGRSPASLRLLKVIRSHFSYVTAISAMQNAALTV